MDADCYSFGAKLGSGVYGEVRLAQCTMTGEVAVKSLRVRAQRRSWPLSAFERVSVTTQRAEREREVWRRAGEHANIVCLQDVFWTVAGVHFVMERCNSSLEARLPCLRKAPLIHVQDLAAQLLKGLAHLHSRQIVHRDIKPANVLLAHGDSSNSIWKICDFGCAFVAGDGSDPGLCGTPNFWAPEVLCGATATSKADVWAAGVTLYIALMGVHPYRSQSGRTPELVKSGVRVPSFKPTRRCERPEWHDNNAKARSVDVLETLMARDPVSRAEAAEALEMPFVAAASSPHVQKFGDGYKQADALHSDSDDETRATGLSSEDLNWQ